MSKRPEKLEGIAAVLKEQRDVSNELVESLLAVDSIPTDLESLSNTGWHLVPATADDPEQRHVYRDTSGHLLIEGPSLIIQTARGVSPEDAEALALEHGLSIQRTMGMRRNMFEVALADGAERRDPLELCATLEQDTRVKWADPSFIETLGVRDVSDD